MINRLVLVFAVFGLLASGYGSAQAAGLDGLKIFVGKWRGKGRIVVKDGRPAEAIVCRSKGRAGGKVFTISGRCGGGNYTGTFTISIRAAGGRYTGSWRSSRTRKPVAFSGSGNGRTFRFRASTPAGSGGELSSIVIRSQSASKFRLTASGRDTRKNIAGSLTIDFRRR